MFISYPCGDGLCKVKRTWIFPWGLFENGLCGSASARALVGCGRHLGRSFGFGRTGVELLPQDVSSRAPVPGSVTAEPQVPSSALSAGRFGLEASANVANKGEKPSSQAEGKSFRWNEKMGKYRLQWSRERRKFSKTWIRVFLMGHVRHCLKPRCVTERKQRNKLFFTYNFRGWWQKNLREMILWVRWLCTASSALLY